MIIWVFLLVVSNPPNHKVYISLYSSKARCEKFLAGLQKNQVAACISKVVRK